MVYTPAFTKLLYGLLGLFAWGHSALAQVGLREIQSHGMPIRVLYPSAEANKPLKNGTFAFEAAPDAPALPGAHRLVVLSHGSGGSQIEGHALAATLVRAGFVVAQPLHRGDNFQDFSQAGPASWQTRPDEISETIHALSQDATLGPMLQTDRVGVHGMSAGGVTALALAGAQWRMIDLIHHCNEHLDADIGFCLYGLKTSPAMQLFRRFQFALTREIAAVQMRDGLPNPAFTNAQRQSGFDRIATFFVQQLNKP